jgi:hypothetical protein
MMSYRLIVVLSNNASERDAIAGVASLRQRAAQRDR